MIKYAISNRNVTENYYKDVALIKGPTIRLLYSHLMAIIYIVEADIKWGPGPYGDGVGAGGGRSYPLAG